MTSNEESFEFEFPGEDTPEVQAAVQAAAEAVTPPVELNPPTVTPPASPTTPVEDTTQQEDFSNFSQAALLALSLQQVDKELPEDLEIKPDLSMSELKALIKESATRREEEEKEKFLQEREEAAKAHLAEKGLTDSHYAYIQQIINGGDPQVVSRVAQYRSWAEAELETEEEFEAAVKAGLQIKYGTSEDALKMIDSYIKNDLKEGDALAEAAKAQQEYIGQVAAYLENEDKKRVEAIKAQQQQEQQRFHKDVEKQIKSGFYGLKLDKEEQKALIDYVTKEVVPIDIETPQGKKRIKVTQEEADRRRDSTDLTKRVYEAYMRKTGYDKAVNKLADVVSSTAHDKFLKHLDKETRQPQPQEPKGELYMSFEI